MSGIKKVKKKITKQDIMKYRGYKFYKEKEDGSFEIIRFLGEIHTEENEFILTVMNDETDFVEGISYTDMKEQYTPITPEGIVSFNIVYMDDAQKEKDIMILMYRAIEFAIGMTDPYAICRQSINDFFSDFVVKDVLNNHLVGVSCTRENCPGNIDFKYIMSCAGIQRSDIVNYYKDDNFDTLLKCIPIEKYDKVLNVLYEEHIKFASDPIAAAAGTIYDGWCRHLTDLININNCIADFNQMNNIIGIDFDLMDHMNKSTEASYELDQAARLFLSEVTKCNIISTRVTEYNYSIDMSKFNNTNYTLIRDKVGKVYLVVYLANGEYLEEELQEQINQLDITDKLRLAYYNKYSKIEN